VTLITESHPSNRHNHFRKFMQRLRQLVAALMILTVISMFSAPLMACEAAGHRCAMMSHASRPVPSAHKAKHDCCPKGTEAPAPAKPSCHEHSVVMPANCATSTTCCEMGNAPVVSVVQAEPAKRSLNAIAIEAPPPPLLALNAQVDRDPAIPRHPRRVFELKTDLRI
jgi:hypothetical protein